MLSPGGYSDLGGYGYTHQGAVCYDKTPEQLEYNRTIERRGWKPGPKIKIVMPKFNHAHGAISEYVQDSPSNEEILWQFQNVVENELCPRDYNFIDREKFIRQSMRDAILLLADDIVPASYIDTSNNREVIYTEDQRRGVAQNMHSYRMDIREKILNGLRKSIMDQANFEKSAGAYHTDNISYCDPYSSSTW
jgi:hypothetical protein